MHVEFHQSLRFLGVVTCLQGLGEELALCFAKHGARLILTARNEERLGVSDIIILILLQSPLAADPCI